MDGRCPRKLGTHPDSWCPLAVLRLKNIRNASKELTEEEESKLPGCPWAINHQLANYCFFKYMNEFGEDAPPTDSDIAHMLNVSVDTVKKTQKNAIEKMRSSKNFADIIDSNKGSSSPIMPDNDVDSFNVTK